MIFTPEPTAIVCHDAGGANIILEGARTQPDHQFLAVMAGPAARLWAENPIPGVPLLGLDAALHDARFVVTGTGWACDLEHRARIQARQRGVHCAAVLDHWVNYRERFERQGQVVLPDEIWVTDSYAKAEAEKIFPGLPVKQKINHYLERMRALLAVPVETDQPRVLYVLEPLRFDWPGLSQPGEFEALTYFTRSLSVLGLPADTEITLRPHPSDPPGKYDEWLAQHPKINAHVEADTPLWQAMARASWVVGCESMALVVALASGRQVVSTLPPAAPVCRLPHSDIIHLRTLAPATS